MADYCLFFTKHGYRACSIPNRHQTSDNREMQLRVFPNPATDVVTVDYCFTDWSKGNTQLEITNTIGQVVYAQELPQYSGFQKVNVSSFARGSYTVYIKRGNAVVAREKMMKE